ncbi:conjugal transfer protein TrbH [Nitratireductor aquibiodomus RA22]|uniref:Conjugal transfer protein TrbH n=1 Tax=Nitratireductor aquibiodomus RA22 TaxID=1189611 RepID=I5BSQ9_9HYPH|nr:conjugal transfer protein TrbH [Nitratireductor aquibiodomus]EIM72611.1 conjugal transfer protein TrbH [Nitratireductor aquibiodomus RA22]
MHRSILLPRLVAFVLCAALLAGCQTLGGAGLVSSSATAQLTPEAASLIAGDMVGRFAEQVGPGTTTIQLKPDGSIFGEALESSLRAWGYAVATDQVTEGTNTVGLAYVVDAFEGSILVRLSTQTLDLTRMYQLGGEGATPVSPLSIMQREAREPS